MYRQIRGARFEYREQEKQRVRDSASLSDKFRRLKSLTVRLDFHTPDDVLKSRQLKYVVNLAHARSVFRFDCPNSECIRGDFDLTEELASAVARHRTTVTGSVACRGWRNKAGIGSARCRNSLRYTLTLAY